MKCLCILLNETKTKTYTGVAEDVEKRLTQPLEDAIKQVADIRFVLSSSRENVSSVLVRFRDIPERVFDKRVNDLRREIQNKARSELPHQIPHYPPPI